MVAAVGHEVTHIDQAVSDAALVTDLTPHLQCLLEVAQRVLSFAEQGLRIRHFVQAGSEGTLLAYAPPDRKRFLFIAQGVRRLTQHPVSDRQSVQTSSLLFLVVHLDGDAVSAIQGLKAGLGVAAIGGYAS